MYGEVSIYGMYMPTLLLLTFEAILVSRVLGSLLARVGVYRLVWHPALFDAALFVIILACLSYFFPRGY